MTVPVVPGTALASAGGLWLEPWLWDAALATAVIETPIFWLCGYRRMAEWSWFAIVNLVSNLLLNEFLGALPPAFPYGAAVLSGEFFVVLLESALCGYVIRGNDGRLLRVLLVTNAASFLAGAAYFL